MLLNYANLVFLRENTNFFIKNFTSSLIFTLFFVILSPINLKTNSNQHENEKNLFYNKIERLQDKNILPDFLTKGDEINSNLNKNYHFDFDSFFHNLEFHPCLGKSLFISSKGSFLS